jgi:hypothetical protein
MVRVSTLTIGVIALAALTAEADTVTTRDSRSWNGNVTNTQGGILTLNATFPSGMQTLLFGAAYIRAIEFNTTTYNPGANPLKLLPKPDGGQLRGAVYMRNKTPPHKCAMDITIDGTHVNCDGQSLDRQNVMRVLVAAQ